jgi:hypothetical protein
MAELISKISDGLAATLQIKDNATLTKRVHLIKELLVDFKPHFLVSNSFNSALVRLIKNENIRVKRKQELDDTKELLEHNIIEEHEIIDYLSSIPAVNGSSYEPSLEESKRGMFDYTPVDKKAIDYM